MSEHQFISDLKFGQESERIVMSELKSKGYRVYPSEPYCDYDIIIEKRVEVKTDKMSQKTGNVAIEVSYKGEPSGVMTTTAEYIAYRLLPDKKAWFCKTSDLREYLMNANIIYGGDYGYSGLALIKLEEFYKIFNRLG
jgi:hypothetical protein